MKTFWEAPTILDSIKNTCGSWKEVKISTLAGVWKKFIPTLMNDFEGFNTLVEEVTTDVVELARELKLEEKPEDVTQLLQFYDKTLMHESCFL